MEALILTRYVACMVDLGWRVIKLDPKTEKGGLGWFAHCKESNDA
jgi:hypothetical protein